MTAKKKNEEIKEEVKKEQKPELPESIKRISDLVPDEIKVEIDKLATEHVNFLLEIIWPIAHAEFVHGARHGYELRHNYQQTDKEIKDLDVKGFTRKLEKKEDKEK